MKKVVVTVPVPNADAVRQAIGNAGAGAGWGGKYSFASFSSRGTGRFLPLPGANPAIGKIGALEVVDEERIEVTCDDAVLAEVISAIRSAHPYEEPVIDVYQLL